MELRIRACHVTGEFVAKDNKPPAISRNHRLANPAAHNYDRISHPPSTYAHEKIKVEVRQPAAERFIVEHGLNEFLPGERSRPRHHRAGRHHQCPGARPRPAGARGQGPDPGAERHAPAGARPDRRVLQGQARRADRRGGLARLHRAGDPRDPAQARHRHQALRQGCAADGRRIHRRGGDRGPAEILRPVGQRHRPLQAARALRGGARRPRRGAAPAGRAVAAPPARLLRRLPGAAGVLGDQAASSARSARSTSRATSAAIPSRRSRRSTSAIRSWASACRSPPQAPSRRSCSGAPSR